MKSFSLNNKTYEVIEERGAFYYGKDNKGKVKVVEKAKVEIVEIESLPKAKTYKTRKPAVVKADPVQTWKDIALSVNDQWNSNSTWQLAADKFGKLDANGNEFIQSLKNAMFMNNRLTEKQAYYLAKYGVESGQLK